MSRIQSRRSFLQRSVTAGSLVGLGELGFLSNLQPVSADETQLDPSTVQLSSGVDWVVRLLEETPREQLLETVAAQIREGLSYRELLAGLLLAGVLNVEPRPSVGHKFHAVLVVNSAHLASISSPPEHRWLPIFWALDYYKSAAARDVEERGDWRMRRVDQAAIPTARKAPQAFLDAMASWDAGAADRAIVGLARGAGANATYESLFRLGARDFRSIGHKAIFVANSWRTLQCIGWQHAEPVLRSLAYALLMHEGQNPSARDAEPDRPYRRNLELSAQIRADWLDGQLVAAATSELLATLRTGSNDEVCDQVVQLLNRGIGPQTVWDALHLGAGELLMRQPGIVALHAVTTTNALHFAFQVAADDTTRRLLLLQNAAFLPMFRGAMQARGAVPAITIDDLQPATAAAAASRTPAEIFAQLSSDPMSAARSVLGHLAEAGDPKPLMDAARVLVFLKGDNAHDYKFSSAVLEDYYQVSAAWRDRYLATSVFQLRGSQGADNRLVARTRAALGQS